MVGGLGVSLLGLAACTGLMLRGASTHKGAPANAIARFTAPECKDLASGSRMPGTSSYYFLAPGSGIFELFEVEQNGRATRITNYWKDERGHNWQAFVRGKQAWHYIVPDDQNQVGYRYVFVKNSYSHQGTNTSFRLTGQPQIECPLIPVDTQGRPMAAAPVADGGTADSGVQDTEDAGANPEACAPGATQECVGAGGCRGGQSCLPDGSSWDACDCGESTDGGNDPDGGESTDGGNAP